MNHCCSGGDTAAPGVVRPRACTWSRRVAEVIEWALPITALALVPKCPACVAGYVLLFTGVGLSIPAATAVRWVLICLCTAAIAFLVLRLGLGLLKRGGRVA